MSLKLYLDDCAFSYRLRSLLIEAGHDVEIPADTIPPLTGADDVEHLAHAIAAERVLLTFNPRDFKRLHDQNKRHPGILAVYQDNNPAKDMNYRDIVRAIANLECGVDKISESFWILNAYKW